MIGRFPTARRGSRSGRPPSGCSRAASPSSTRARRSRPTTSSSPPARASRGRSGGRGCSRPRTPCRSSGSSPWTRPAGSRPSSWKGTRHGDPRVRWPYRRCCSRTWTPPSKGILPTRLEPFGGHSNDPEASASPPRSLGSSFRLRDLLLTEPRCENRRKPRLSLHSRSQGRSWLRGWRTPRWPI